MVVSVVCDVMLGRLARDRHMAGFQTDYQKEAEGDGRTRA